jgi:ABC-type phosphate/phosphonate transport system permease subunit
MTAIDPRDLSRTELEDAYRRRTEPAPGSPVTTTKAQYAGGSAALATVVITWLLSEYVPTMPPTVQAAVAGLVIGVITAVVTYLSPPNKPRP